MDAELAKYKEKISDYSIEELEEILISLNKDKFPEKYDLVKNCLAEKIQNKLGHSVNPIVEIKILEEKKEPVKAAVQEEKQEQKVIKEELNEKENEKNSLTVAQVIFSVIIIFTSIFSAYVLLLTSYNLPGKKLIISTCKNIPLFNSSSSLKAEKNS